MLLSEMGTSIQTCPMLVEVLKVALSYVTSAVFFIFPADSTVNFTYTGWSTRR